jgi:hypothetical protein
MANGYKPHEGDGRPCNAQAFVAVRHRDGSERLRIRAASLSWYHDHRDPDNDITHWRYASDKD